MRDTAPERLSRDDAVRLVRRCLEDGEIILTKHFRDKLEFLGVSMVEARYILQHGVIWNEPEFDLRHRQWNYRIEGTEPDGQHLAVVFAFVEESSSLLITIFSVER